MYRGRRVARLLLTFLASTLTFQAIAQAEPTIHVVAPVSGASVGGFVYFEAYATSAGCASGISAMRIYLADDIVMSTIYSNHIETFVFIAPAGQYNTTIVAYDNCGGASAAKVPITVNSNTGITVFLPTAGSANAPVHVVASAQSTVCSGEIHAMRIYTSDGVTPYSVFSDQIDAFLTLAPGTYNLVVQAWDNCGNVMNTPVPVNVSAASDRFLYASGGATNGDLLLFPLTDGAMGAPSPLLTNFEAKSQFQIRQILVDPAGYFLYATDGQSIFGFQVDRNDGSLHPVPGSPYVMVSSDQEGGILSGLVQISLALDPNGHYLYVANPVTNTVSSYQVDRSDGSLVPLYSVDVPYGKLITNYTGAYLYDVVGGSTNENIYGFAIDFNSGFIASTPGSPYPKPTADNTVVAAWKYLYVGTDPTAGYLINADGSLSDLPGSPFATQGGDSLPLADWRTQYYWYPDTDFSTNPSQGIIRTSAISGASGDIGPPSSTTANDASYVQLAEDHSGKYLYASGSILNEPCTRFCTSAFYVSSWTIGPSGQPIELSPPAKTGVNGQPFGYSVVAPSP